MRFSANRRKAILAVCLPLGLTWVGFLITPRRPALAEPPADFAAPATASDVAAGPPLSHAEIYARLKKPITVDFRRTTRAAVLRRLAETGGIDIEFVDDTDPRVTPKDFDRQLTMIGSEPVSLQRAIQTIIPGDRYCMLLTERGVRIVSQRAAADELVLQTHHLWAASNYTTHMRTRLIEQVRRELAAAGWGEDTGTWIVPARSVFAVDVYHRLAVQRQIDELWQRDYLEKPPAAPAATEATIADFRRFAFFDPKTTSREEIQARAKLLRSEFPLVSIRGRLEYEEKKATAPVALSPTLERALGAREANDERLASKSWGYGRRLESLRQLHSDQVEKFIADPGFGDSRTPSIGPYDLPVQPFSPQPLGSAEVDPPSAEPPLKLPAETPPAAAIAALPGLDRLTSVHGAGVSEFVSLDRLGYVKDRDHVAGFEPHSFGELPRLETSWQGSTYLGGLTEPAQHWVIRRLELVSLLKHDTPRVYLSKDLPRMDQLNGSPTRGLNEFEASALGRLVADEDIVAQATLNRVEMVGAIRAARQCTECHEVSRGQLLGAFSYTLVRDPLIAPPPESSAFRPRPHAR